MTIRSIRHFVFIFSAILFAVPTYADHNGVPHNSLLNPYHQTAFWSFSAVIFLILVITIALYMELQKRKRTEAAFRESEAQIRALLNSTAQAILGVDVDGKCSFCNPAAVELLACKEEEDILGRKIHEFIYPTGDDDIEFYPDDCGICQYCRQGTVLHLNEKTMWKTDGTSYPAELWSLPVMVDGKVEGGVVTFVDITDRLELQKQNIRKTQLATVGELSAMVAHEVNNPLSGVINYAQVILNKIDEDDSNRDLLNRIIKEGERITKIVKGMLHFSYDSGDVKTNQSIVAITLDVLTLVSNLIKKYGVKLEIDMPDDLPQVRCNAQQIEQVILNIVRNACQAISTGVLDGEEEGILRITAEHLTSDDSEYVNLTIANNGPNIPKDIFDKITMPFFTTKSAKFGTGLGLSISNDIMRNHGGELSIKSEHGDYTKMCLKLPAV